MNWNKLLNPKRFRPSKRDVLQSVDPRNEFESDFGRIIFSPAIRRMHDKTQVFPLTADDNIHSRLTHSMEVMAIGHSLGIRLSEQEQFLSKSGMDKNDVLRIIPVILKNACLVHDIGNPPFGHFGEECIQNFFLEFFATKKGKELLKDGSLDELHKVDFLKFDGNAQGFRVLTKLQVLDDHYGLNLTFGTLSASLKYPNTGTIVEEKLNQKKRGVFQSEKDYLEEIAGGCDLYINNEIVRHPLSFIMEAADSICYRVMDLEDGFNKGWYSYDEIKNHLIEVPGMEEIFDRIETDKDIKSEVNKVVQLRIKMISKLVKIAVDNFIRHYDSITAGTYHTELIQDDPNGLEDNLANFSYNKIFPKREIQFLELTGEAVINGLLKYYTKYLFHSNKKYRKRAFNLISKSIIKASILDNGRKSFKRAEEFSNMENNLFYHFEQLNNYSKLQLIVDFVSGMTDQFALNHYQKLSGQRIL